MSTRVDRARRRRARGDMDGVRDWRVAKDAVFAGDGGDVGVWGEDGGEGVDDGTNELRVIMEQGVSLWENIQ